MTPRILAALAAAALTLGACSSSATSGSSTAPSPSTAPTRTPATDVAPIAWKPCTEAELAKATFDCGSLTVPKDYADPSKGTFDLAVARLKATGTADERIGTLFFNPGGPGNSGIDAAPPALGALGPVLRQRFDFVTWDPRGVGRSSGLADCTPATYSLPATGEVDWNAVTEAMRTSETKANADCAAKYPDVVPYIGTNSTVQDLDQLRAAVGDEKLTYWGTSYGTRIGYVYAHDYPETVRAMLLTSPIGSTGTWESFAEGSAVSPDNALGFFFDAYPGALKDFNAVTAALQQAPLTLPSGTQVTHWGVRGTLGAAMTSEDNFPAMAGMLQTLNVAITGTGDAQTKALAELDKAEWMTEYPINSGATAVIGCTDYPQRLTADQQDSMAATMRAQAPIFGFASSQSLFFCDGVTAKPDPVPVDFTNTTTQMLVMGSTRDALTLYQWATDMARTFPNSRVVSYVGTVHTPFLTAGSKCLDSLGTTYLVNGTLPATDVSCPYVGPTQKTTG